MKVNVIRGFKHQTTDSKSVVLWNMSVRVGLGVSLTEDLNFISSILMKY